MANRHYETRGLARVCRYGLAIVTVLFGCQGDQITHYEPQGTAYFLVAQTDFRQYGDSFVLPLTNRQDIETARMIIVGAQKSDTAPVCVIGKGGAEGEYRNVDLLNGKRLWSWRVVAFEAFHGVCAPEACAAPMEIEQAVTQSPGDTVGTLMFCGYTVVTEIMPGEME
jgi:hypothetical protein